MARLDAKETDIMLKKMFALILGLTVSAASWAGAAPMREHYESTPFWLDGQTVPQVMLVLERDWKMFYPAYNNLSDLDGDGALDIGFNPGVTYVGYFDSDSCYAYIRGAGSGAPGGGSTSVTTTGTTGYFVRSGKTLPQTQAEADALAAARGIDGAALSSPASAHGVCVGGGNRNDGAGLWHGNWLNYSMTSRMDAIRKVLYGGKRVVDDPSRTILEMARVPANSNVWGGELYADDVWEEYAPSSPWYAIELFTGFNAPAPGSMHFWARADYYWRTSVYSGQAATAPTPNNTKSNQESATQNPQPLFRFVKNIPKDNRHPFLRVPLRIWDWTGDHASYTSIPSDGHLANSRDQAGNVNTGFMPSRDSLSYNYAARVQVCQADSSGEMEEGCRAYGGAHKPTGLLQEYGESRRMFFGLVSGTISHGGSLGVALNSGTRYKGGVVRHHIQDFGNYVDSSSGLVTRPGLIDTIDSFEITGIDSRIREYIDGSQAGNPLGEMVWEAVRYIGGGALNLNPTSSYGASQTESKVRRVLDPTGFTSTINLPKLNNWVKDRPTLPGNANECPKPVILAISEVIPDHDGDDYPNLNDLKDVPLSPFASKLPGGALNFNSYLNIITETDKLSTSASGGKQFFYPSARGLCTARDLGGLGDIVGHCPSEPSLQGTYNLAAVAYYAHTHDFRLLAGKDDAGQQLYKEANIDFYAVGIPGNFPDITLSVDEARSVSLMPIALTAPSDPGPSRTEGQADPAFRTLLNFFVEYWQTDDGHTDSSGAPRKIPYKVKFRTNFEFTTNPCFLYGGNSNNWERDLFNAVIVTLLTPRTTAAKYREPEPMFINSGPFKTLNKSLYLSQRAAYRAALAAASTPAAQKAVEDQADSYFQESGGQRYYYAFRRPKGEKLDISGLTVAGLTVHSDSVGSGYGASGQTGYTITGVNHPGAYLDVGLNRLDYPVYYSDSGCRPSKSVYGPNLACGDEPVPLDPAGSGLPGAQFNFATASANHPIPLGFQRHLSANANMHDCGYYHPPTLWDELLTPAECPYAGYSESDDWSGEPELQAAYSPRPRAQDVCGRWAAGYGGSIINKNYPTSSGSDFMLFRTSLMRYVQVRSFKFETGAARQASLPNPMWLAAKYGGFRDQDNNGKPNLDSEWIRGGSGVGGRDPYNYFGVANISELPGQLAKAFETISNSVATGTANASSINSVLGGGLSVQTQYRTRYNNGLTWVGSVYALFVDKWGNMRADTSEPADSKRTLQLATSPHPSQWAAKGITEELGDLIVHSIVVSRDEGLDDLYVYLCRDPKGNNNGNSTLPSDKPPRMLLYNGEPDLTGVDQSAPDYDKWNGYPATAQCEPLSSMDEVPSIWNSAQQLSDTAPDARKIYTYPYSAGADGSGPWPGMGTSPDEFTHSSAAVLTELHKLMGQSSETETAKLIRYIRGEDAPDGDDAFRNRTSFMPWPESSGDQVWRLGDVINSKPIIVGEPGGRYHLTYGDQSFAKYASGSAGGGVSNRRQLVYFGANDGMLHAVNLGYFGSLSTGQAGYQQSTGPELGAEEWAYVPTAVLPHLQWLADRNYKHSYFVDLQPNIVDIKFGPDDWRTIMIVGLRLGGNTIELVNDGNKISYSEYFALDVTDPETPPKLMWRFSVPYLGMTIATPSVVRSGDEWYAVLPSGPTSDKNAAPNPSAAMKIKAYGGTSTQKARVFIVDARTGELVGNPEENPDLVVPEDNSFFTAAFVPRANRVNIDRINTPDAQWSHHVVYLSMSVANPEDSSSNSREHYGAVYRLQMADENTGQAWTDPKMWKLKRMFNAEKPVTGAVNSAYDNLGNLWVVFGSGRIWDKDDMVPCGTPITQTCCDNHTQYFYGLKEPLNSHGALSYEEIPNPDLPGPYPPGSAPLLPIVDVSDINVYANGMLDKGNNSDVSATNYNGLYNHLVGQTAGQPDVRGYKRRLATYRIMRDVADSELIEANKYNAYRKTSTEDSRIFELINTQPKIDGLANGRSNTVVTVYQTTFDICNPLGQSYLYLFDTFTGLPAPYMADYIGFDFGHTDSSSSSDVSQVTGVKAAGRGIASEAWIMKGSGQTVYGDTGALGNQVPIIAPNTITSGFMSWREVKEMEFDMGTDGTLFNDLIPTP